MHQLISVPSSRRLLFLLAVGLLSWTSAAAATLQVTVVDESGVAFARMPTVLIDRVADRVVAREETGRSGTALFLEVPPGQYRISIERSDETIVHPDDNPLVNPAEVSIIHDLAEIDARLEVHRGIPFHLRFFVDDSVLRHVATARLEEIESGRRLERRVFQGENVIKLFPGRWRIGLEAADGLLLQSIDVDGRGAGDAILEIDLRANAPAHFVTWEYRSISRISGRVAFEREPFPVQVVASLVEAGAWEAAARTRGVLDDLRQVATDVDTQTGRFTIELPDGTWSLEPSGDELATADPNTEIVELGPADELRASFLVRRKAPGPRPLEVNVLNPSGDPVDQAIVELWPLDEVAREALEHPIHTGITDDRGIAAIDSVQAGDFLIAAAHPDHPEAITELIGFAPGADDIVSPVVTLNSGGRIEVTLLDSRGLVTGDTWVVANSPDAKPYYVRSESIVDATRLPRALVDQTDRAILRGLYPGTYEVAALTPTAFIQFFEREKEPGLFPDLQDLDRLDDPDAGGVELLEVRLHANEVLQLEARALPAGLVTGRLYCRDGSPVPIRVDLRVVPNKFQPSHPLDTRWSDNVTLSLDDVILTGPLGNSRDRFDAGPLEPASYVLALQPAGFDRWTWAFGTEDGAEAGSFELGEGAQVDLGGIGVDCGPVVRLTPEVGSGAPAPDLRDLRLQTEYLEVSGHVRSLDGERTEPREIDIDAYREGILLGGLTEGQADLRVRLGHRYFLPDFWIEVPITAELERGRTLAVTIPIDGVGGAIAIHARDTAAARLVDGETALAPIALDGERVTLANVPAGTYSVELCADVECREIRNRWPEVTVTTAATIQLAFGFPDPTMAEPPGPPAGSAARSR